MSALGEPPAHVVRVSEEARRQIDAELVRIYDAAGEAAAIAWRDGMEEAIAGLATLPERCPAAPEDALYQRGTLRQFLYRRRRGGPAWRILFSVRPADESDAPTVRVHQVRHGAQAPMTAWPPDESVGS